MHGGLTADRSVGSVLSCWEFIHQPGTPLVERGVDGSVAQVFAVGGDAEDVAGEEFGDEALVVVVDLFGAVEPTDGLADGGFGFDDARAASR